MGTVNTATRQFMMKNEIAADVFNFLLYDGQQIIQPENLTELDTAAADFPYALQFSDGHDHSSARIEGQPLEKYRDILKQLTLKTDGETVYAILGIENQDSIHYAMPIRNMLYDALSLLNYSVEVPIGKHISLLGYHQFPWWTWGEAKNQYCIRFLSVGAEGRWWFNSTLNANRKDKRKRDKLTGHFLGIYGESGKWDFQWDRSICHQGEHWSAGLSYGYAMPVNKFVNIEFSISAGYASIPYRKYVPSENYEILWSQPAERGRWHYFGPTKAQVSLVIPFTVKTTKKGGRP